jgi:hypothetical protein
MVEYHVDDGVDYEFHKRMTTDAVEFGGNLSVRRDPTSKPLIVFGQDECIFKQFLFMYKFWIGRKGERPLLPKDEGQGGKSTKMSMQQSN